MEFVPQELGALSSKTNPLTLIDIDNNDTSDVPPGSVVLLRSPQNKGYAAGNNAGIRLLMRWGADVVWVLNNDTIVDKKALGVMESHLVAMKRPDLYGAGIQYMGTNLVQCRAGGMTPSGQGYPTSTA